MWLGSALELPERPPLRLRSSDSVAYSEVDYRAEVSDYLAAAADSDGTDWSSD